MRERDYWRSNWHIKASTVAHKRTIPLPCGKQSCKILTRDDEFLFVWCSAPPRAATFPQLFLLSPTAALLSENQAWQRRTVQFAAVWLWINGRLHLCHRLSEGVFTCACVQEGPGQWEVKCNQRQAGVENEILLSNGLTFGISLHNFTWLARKLVGRVILRQTLPVQHLWIRQMNAWRFHSSFTACVTRQSRSFSWKMMESEP